MENQQDELTVLLRKNYKRLGLWWAFWRGVITSLGATVGLALIAAGLAYALKKAGVLATLGLDVGQLKQLIEALEQLSKQQIPL